MVTLLIIADDFTGALDTGVKFAASGAAVRVVTDYDYEFGRAGDGVDVLVFDAETRHISSRDAYDRVFRIVKKAKKAGIPHIYKKTDSALRGNIGSELSAVLDATGASVLPFLPAFPKMGRTTINGIHYIDGIPVAKSVFGRDPFEPVVCSSISEMIKIQSRVNVRVISNGEVLKGNENPMTEIKSPVLAVYDGQTDEELKKVTEKLYEAGELGIMAGCAGMAEALPNLLGLKGAPPKIPKFVPKFLVACGSVNPITKVQLDYAEQHGFQRIRLTPKEKLEPGYFDTQAGKERLRAVLEQYQSSKLSILDTNDGEGLPDTLTYAKSQGLGLEELRVNIASTLGYLLKVLVESGVESTMLITGGDSLLGFMNQIQADEMTPVCEMAPGTVLSQFEIHGRMYKVISKSGGFGARTLFMELAEMILKGKEEEIIC